MQGYTKCNVCYGYGRVESTQVWHQECKCTNCNGTGKVPIDVKNICTRCKGEGLIDGPAYWCRELVCPDCKGSGRKES